MTLSLLTLNTISSTLNLAFLFVTAKMYLPTRQINHCSKSTFKTVEKSVQS